MKIALITGAGSGLGQAVARRLANEGWRVAAADVALEAVRTLAMGLPGTGHLPLAMDVGDPQAVARGFEAAEAECGPVTALLCFAGVVTPWSNGKPVSLARMDLSEWERVMRVNATGTFLCVREMLNRRQARPVENGRIVTVSSLGGQMGALESGAAYGGSKGAVLALTKVAAREAAALGITVNNIAPGPIDTPMLRQVVADQSVGQTRRDDGRVPLGRVGTPDEIAAAVSYLLSPQAAFMTGATLDINGGMGMR